MAGVSLSEDAGCPSGLAPAAAGQGTIDPAAFVRERDGENTLELSVQGAKCAGCIAKIEKAMNALPGVTLARLNLSTGKLRVAWKGSLAPARITATLSDIGYDAVPFDPAASERENDAHGRFLLKCLAVAGFATANIMLLSVGVWASGGEMGEGTRGLMHFISALIAFPAALYAGRPFFSSAWKALRNGQANMDVPISLAVILALGFSAFEAFVHGGETYFDAAVMLLFFLLIGRWLDHSLRDRARSAARDLLALQAVTARRIAADGTIGSVSARDIEVGDTILLSPGDRVPVNGRLLDGASEMDRSLVTGESAPVLLDKDADVEAGIVNLSRPVRMIATARADDSLVADLARLVEAGQQAKGRIVRLADKASRLYVPVVHSLAAATFLGWFFIGGAGLRISLMNAIAVLIITCPCALGLATPAVQVVATGRLFRKGILVKTGDALERLARITRVAFDKTGTLTLGSLRLVNAEEIVPETLSLAAGLARASRHPVSRAIVQAAGPGKVTPGVEETPGMGLEAMVQDQRVRLGRAEFVGAASEEDGVATWLRIGDGAPIPFRFEDTVRPGAADLIARLKAEGLAVTMLSGDARPAVARIAEVSGIGDWHAGLTPAEKIGLLKQADAENDRVLMVGDGLNDAPALASAHVSISPGTAAEAAQSAADIVFQGQDMAAVGEAMDVARAARRRVLENFAFAACYNAIAAPLAMAGFVTPLIAALAMSGSSLIVILNALRLNLEGGRT